MSDFLHFQNLRSVSDLPKFSGIGTDEEFHRLPGIDLQFSIFQNGRYKNEESILTAGGFSQEKYHTLLSASRWSIHQKNKFLRSYFPFSDL